MSAAPRPPAEERIRDYLLRRLPDDERARFEESYFADDALLDRVEAEEDRLVSEYVLGRLSDSERRRFEDSLLDSPYYRERVETTSRLRRRIESRASTKTRPKLAAPRRLEATSPSARARLSAEAQLFPGRSGLLVAFALLAVSLVAAVASALRLRSELVDARAEQSRLTALQGSTALEPRTLILLPETSAEPKAVPRKVELLSGVPILIAFPRALLPDGAVAWKLRIKRPDGQEVWQGAPVRPLGPEPADVSTRLPQGVLPAGSSQLVLDAETEKGWTQAYEITVSVTDSPNR